MDVVALAVLDDEIASLYVKEDDIRKAGSDFMKLMEVRGLINDLKAKRRAYLDQFEETRLVA